MTTITIMATHPRLPSLQNLIFAVLHGLHQGWLPWYRTSRNMIAVFRCTLRLCTSVKVLRQSKHKNYQIPNQTRILLQNWQLRRVFLMDSFVAHKANYMRKRKFFIRIILFADWIRFVQVVIHTHVFFQAAERRLLVTLLHWFMASMNFF